MLHLARRFLGSLRPRFPDPQGQRLAAAYLGEAEAALFWRQATADLNHATSVAARVAAIHPERGDLIRTALLHDVGKVEAPLGPVRRSLATVLAVMRLPRPGRLQTYLDHPDIGADRLEAIDADALVIAFARHHRSSQPPASVDPADWAILWQADQDA